MPKIHQGAVVESGARLADDVVVGAGAYVGPEVELGPGVVLAPHAHVCGRTRIGEGCRVFPYAVVGEEPQDTDFKPENATALRIGKRNVIREHTAIHVGTLKGGGCTEIGDDNLFMNGTHVGHDAKIGSHVIVASNAALAGHCEVQDYAVIGGLSGVHQFARVGESAMVGALSGVSLDAPPFMIVSGERTTLRGVNHVGLKRRDFSEQENKEIKRAYHIIFQSKLRFAEALDRIREEGLKTDPVSRLLRFLESSERGFSRK